MWRAETVRVGLASIAALSFALAVPAVAQDDTRQADKRPVVSRNPPPSSNATINLINMLVKQGVLGEEQATMLIKQADDEAYVARQAVRDAATKAEGADKKASTAVDAASPPGTKRVTYVPEIVKQQLREDIKRDVMAKAEKENWASPGKYPEWAQRIRFYGDIRARYEGDFFPSGNGPLVNFNAINTGAPFLEPDSNPTNPYAPPSFNTTQNRERFRFRARLGLDADLLNGFSAGLRIATGDSSSPVSTNQTFGGNGGDFSKYALWLDRAFIRYQAWGDDLNLSVGRFDNPFWSSTDLVWYKELGFDGFAVQAKRQITDSLTPFAVAGAFPIFNTDLNAGVNLDTTGTGVPTKFASTDKYLFGGQVGFAARLPAESGLRLAAAFYDFNNVQYRLSSPCVVVVSPTDVCDTDTLRPSFAQKGNTYTQLRNNVPVVGIAFTDYQYYGLASQYRPVVASGQLDLGEFHPVHVVLDGEYVWNSAFDRNAVAVVAANNFAPAPGGVTGPFNGGNIGWLARLTVGNKEIRHLWDWNAHVGYKYLESDATVDAFVDSDFGLGGTNLKGYFIGANLGLGENVWASARWMSANGIAGVPYAVDVFQLDLNARF